MKISVILPVCAFPTPADMEGMPHPRLRASLDSIAKAGHQDIEILIGSDGVLPKVKNEVDSWALSTHLKQPQIRYFEYPFSGKWGNPQRNALLKEASGDIVCFQDQDDEFFPNALADVNRVCEENPGRPLIFRMAAFHINGTPLKEPWVMWKKEGTLAKGQVGGHMFVVPNVKKMLGTWREDVYEGDWYFITETLQRFEATGISPCWRGEFVSITRPWARVR